MFADIFRLAHHSLLKKKKYEALVYNKDQTRVEINEITDSTSKMKINNQSKMSETSKMENIKNYTFRGNCWKCGNLAIR